jgi:hypothetical protein
LTSGVWRIEPTIAQVTLTLLVKVLTANSESVSSSPHATLLTLPPLITDALGTPLSRSLLAVGAEARATLRSVLVQTLLHEDRVVRVAAASLAFNFWVQKGRVGRIKGAREEDGE